MRAAVWRTFGNPKEVVSVEEIPKPSPSANQILVRVKAAGLNLLDSKAIEGLLTMLFRTQSVNTVGCDLAGIVEEVGANVTRFQKGDEIIGFLEPPVLFKISPINSFVKFGAVAQYAVIQERLAAKKPQNITFEEAAGIPCAALTAFGLLKMAHVRPGQKILILGGSGGVGSLAIQIAKTMSANITTTCSTRNVEFVKNLGADRVIDYTKENWGQVLRGQKYDAVIDCVGKAWVDAQLVTKSGINLPRNRSDPQGGHFVTITGDDPFLSFNIFNMVGFGMTITWRKLLSWLGGPSYDFYVMIPTQADLEAVAKMVTEGSLRCIVDKVYKLDQILQALEHVLSRRARGKVIVSIE